MPAVAGNPRRSSSRLSVLPAFVVEPLRVLFCYWQICLAKPAEFFAQFYLTKPELAEKDCSPGSFLPLSERPSQN